MSNPFDEDHQADTPVPVAAKSATTGSVGQSTATTVQVQEDGAASVPPDDNLYAPSTSPCSPLVQLQMYGFCCPFLETEEEHDARIGAHHLQNYPITWYRTKLVKDVVRDVKGGIDNVSKEAGGIIGGLVTNFDRLMGKNSPSSASLPMMHMGVPALLSIFDSEDHGPVIEIRAKEEQEEKPDDLSNSDTQDEKKEVKIGNSTISIQHAEPAPRPWWEEPELKSSIPAKVIPLYLIDSVSCGYSLFNDPTAGGIKLFAAPPANSGMFGSSGAELLRFDTLGGGGNVLSDSLFPIKAEEPNKYSDKVIAQLRSLVAWNRRRIADDIKKGKARIAPKGNGGGGLVVS